MTHVYSEKCKKKKKIIRWLERGPGREGPGNGLGLSPPLHLGLLHRKRRPGHSARLQHNHKEGRLDSS